MSFMFVNFFSCAANTMKKDYIVSYNISELN